MLVVYIPNNNLLEREYVINTIFGEFLGLDFKVKKDNNPNTTISFNNKRIEIVDSLWNGKEDLGYLSIDNIPTVKYVTNKFAVEKDIPVLYGDGNIDESEDSIYCGIDIFASIFFMLTRWEESVVSKLDEHERFIGKESVAYKAGFLNRPIVNEYIELLWNMMVALGYEDNRCDRTFKLVLTHDIDFPFMRYRFLRISKYIANCLMRFHLNDALSYFPFYLQDPYDTYDFFMDVSEMADTESHFYFMSDGPDKRLINYSTGKKKRFRSIVDNITKRGHEVGFHPGYASFFNNITWRKEKEELESVINKKVLEGRQHYLRFKMPETFVLWEENRMEYDSTLSYFDVEGFRCGTGDSFPVFNFIERKTYKLKERPLIVMDATLVSYRDYTIEKIRNVLEYYIVLGKKYRMQITFLFHNSSFMGKKGCALKNIYRKVLLGSE